MHGEQNIKNSPNSQFVGALPQSRKPSVSFVMSLRLSIFPQVSARLPLDGFSLNLLHETFIKIGREESRFWLKWVENIEHFILRPR